MDDSMHTSLCYTLVSLQLAVGRAVDVIYDGVLVVQHRASGRTIIASVHAHSGKTKRCRVVQLIIEFAFRIGGG